MANPEGYNISVKEAAQALGKSIRTVHRYIDHGKLSKTYVSTSHGSEIRLKQEEIFRLAQELNDGEVNMEESAFGDDNPFTLNIREVLARYERALYQLGELTEKLKNTEDKANERVRKLEEERDRLRVRKLNHESAIKELREEIERPLSLLDRIRGKRRPKM